MSVKWEKLEGNEGILTIEVDAVTVNKGIDEAFKKVVSKVNVPGFRKGKVPRGMFEKRFGVESLYQDALDILLPTAYENAIKETGIDPIDRPEIDIEQIEKGQNLIFTAKVTVKPEVVLGEYKNLEVEMLDTNVSDEDVDQELKQLQERHAELVVKEEGTIEDGDTVIMDFTGFVDGVTFEGGDAENFSLVIGSGNFIPGFEDQLVGVATGEEKDVDVTFPEEYHAADLAGKPATFKVKIHEIKAKELPALDDEFAKDLNEEVETIAELKAKTLARLEETRKQESENKLRDALVDQATENATIDIPQAMVKTEQDRMLREFEQRLQGQGMNLELYFQFSGTDEEALRTQMSEDAEKRVRMNLTLEAIAQAENLQVSDEELAEELEKMSVMYQTTVENIKNMIGNVDLLKEDIKIRKAIDFLVDNSKATA
ncbi:trigger factor [Bacillus sp. DJP31]|uniref:trigger factor n=1 Tax=Bacillus sp. DJP31 TaxID=3409789 RepID=UPI003BB6157A